MRYAAILLLVSLCSCQSMVNGYVDRYMDSAERNATAASKLAAEDVGAPTDLYADLWDVNADPANRLRLAGILISDMVRNAVNPQDIVHVSLATGAMMAYVYRPRADDP